MTGLSARRIVSEDVVKGVSALAGTFAAGKLGLVRSILIACLLAGNPAWSQSTFGTINGTVRDASGSVIQTCKVTVANKGTSSQRSLLTDQDGNYAFTNLEPGEYVITLEAPGFQRASYPDVQLDRKSTRLNSSHVR